MRLADPSIRFMMAGYRFPLEGLREMLDIAGGHIDFVIQRRGDPEFVAENLKIIREYNRDTGRDVRLVNTEWLGGFPNHVPFEDPSVPPFFERRGLIITDSYYDSMNYAQTRWYYALNAACRVVDYMTYGGEFHSANFNNCCNTWGQNIVEASKDKAWLSCAGEMFAFFGRHFREGAQVQPYETGDEYVRAAELKNADGRTLYLVNNTDKAVEVELDGDWQGECLSGPGQLAQVTEDNNPLMREALTGAGPLTLPPWSLTAVVR